jgi:hypothetical protein
MQKPIHEQWHILVLLDDVLVVFAVDVEEVISEVDDKKRISVTVCEKPYTVTYRACTIITCITLTPSFPSLLRFPTRDLSTIDCC